MKKTRRSVALAPSEKKRSHNRRRNSGPPAGFGKPGRLIPVFLVGVPRPPGPRPKNFSPVRCLENGFHGRSPRPHIIRPGKTARNPSLGPCLPHHRPGPLMVPLSRQAFPGAVNTAQILAPTGKASPRPAFENLSNFAVFSQIRLPCKLARGQKAH